MTASTRHRKTAGLTARAAALAAVHARLDASLAREMARPLPDAGRLQRLKRMKLRTKDEIASIDGLVRAQDRGWSSRLH